MSAGRPPMADRPVTGDQGAVQIRHLAGPHAARLGAGARTARSSGTADCGGNHARRLVSAMAAGLDGSTLDVVDDPANEAAFGRPASSRGPSAYPQIRFVSFLENGTHVLFGSRM